MALWAPEKKAFPFRQLTALETSTGRSGSAPSTRRQAHFIPLPPMASYRRGPVEQGPGIGPSALGEATLDQARLETAALHPPQPMQESKPFVALAKTENGWVFEMSEVPLPYPLYQTGVRVWLAPCTTLEFI